MATKRTVILGVTGSIAAYKAADMASKLKKLGHDVFCVMTSDATHFITPLTLQTLSQHPVTIDLFEEGEGDWRPSHLQLADAADLFVIAPATANVIAKLAHGIADDALTTIALALRPKAKVLIAPAMNGKMWLHPGDAGECEAAAIARRRVYRPREGIARLRLRRHRPAVGRGQDHRANTEDSHLAMLF